MRGYDCHKYHLINKELVKNSNTACWAGLNKSEYLGKDIYIDKYIEPEITDKQRKRIIYLLNKITPCKFKTIKNVKYIQFKLLKYHYSNLLLLNFIRILWYKNKIFNNEQFFIDICKPKTKGLDYLEFMMTCIKNNVESNDSWNHGDHSFVYANIIPKTKEILLEYTGSSMQNFLQCKIEDVK
jgi:hypothetical protein